MGCNHVGGGTRSIPLWKTWVLTARSAVSTQASVHHSRASRRDMSNSLEERCRLAEPWRVAIRRRSHLAPAATPAADVWISRSASASRVIKT